MARGRLITSGGLAFCALGVLSAVGATTGLVAAWWIRLTRGSGGFSPPGPTPALAATDQALIEGLSWGSAAVAAASAVAMLIGVAVAIVGLRQKHAQARTSTLVITVLLALVVLPYDGMLLWVTLRAGP
ncbi:MAG: hypothetical protein H6738_03215 [Alphaproteobacteria bacterium]|nr:hypothetical protein [Alphaproteobacteria bacterium]MCB9695780.1 hypothetical protein [Alphaproteobacteria bacterium]